MLLQFLNIVSTLFLSFTIFKKRIETIFVLCAIQDSFTIDQLDLNPGGGGALPLLTVVGTCRWTGYDFPVINIDTGYLNRPNWLLAGYSVYHMVASQPTMFMTGPRSRHQRRCV